MKHLILFATIVASACLPGFAQEKIEGLGKFKINKTSLSVVDELANELNVKLKIIDNSMEKSVIQEKKPRIIEIIKNRKEPFRSPSYSTNCPGVRVFYINKYKIADIEIESIYLTFRDNVLVRLQCENSTELNKAIELKYGIPEKEVDKKPVNCLYKFSGNKVELEESSYRSYWKNENIVAVSLLMTWYNDKCEKNFAYDFSVEALGTLTEITQCDYKLEKKENDSKDQKLKSKLSDL